MLVYLLFDSLLFTCSKKMQTKKWPKAADSPVPALIQNKQLFAFLFALLDPLL